MIAAVDIKNANLGMVHLIPNDFDTCEGGNGAAMDSFSSIGSIQMSILSFKK